MSVDLLDEIEHLLSEGRSWPEIGQSLNVHPEKIRSRWRRSGRTVDVVNATTEIQDDSLDEFSVVFTDTKKREKVDWRELLELAVSSQNINERLDSSQETATIAIDSDKPVIVLYTGDWHLGSRADYATWLKDINLVLNTEGVFMIDLGDDYQNMRSFKSLAAVLNQVITPPQQAALIKGIVDELTAKNKLLAKIGGNHDQEFDERIFGQALQGYLYAQSNAPVFSNRGVVRLIIGDQEYTNLLFHKSRYRSVFRPAHGAYREWQFSYPAEVVAGAHDHVPAFEVMYGYNWSREMGENYGGEVFLIKIGAYQQSEFGYRYFSNGEIPVMPAVVYYPNTHKKLAFMSLEDAIQYVKSLGENDGTVGVTYQL